MEAAAELLGTGVVFRGSDVDEDSVLLVCVHPLLEQLRKNLFFEAYWSARNVLQYGAAEHIYATIYDARRMGTSFFRETNDAFTGIQPNGSVSRRVGNSAHGHAGEAIVLPMKANKLAQVHFQKRIAIHNQKLGLLLEMP